MKETSESTDLKLRRKEIKSLGATVAKAPLVLYAAKPAGPYHMTSGTCCGCMELKAL